jgi:ribonuclease P protein component
VANKSMAKYTLGKNERLKSRKSIQQLFTQGINFSSTPFRVYYLVNNAATTSANEYLKFGIGVGAKNFKKATDRNRIKRICKEAFRLQRQSLRQCLTEKNHVMDLFLIYTSREMPVYKDVHEKMALVIKKLIKLTGDLK